MAAAAAGQLNLEESPSWGSRGVECFEKLEQIGEGTYGQVYMAKERKTGEVVALKKIRMDNEKEGFPITAIREIKILKKLQHENVIKLKEIVTSPGRETEADEQVNQDGNRYKGSIYMVFEYMDHDLTGLADRPGLRFSVPQIKLLTGLHYCHLNNVLHRDIKGSNLLIDNKGNLKLADFGLARSFSNDHNANLTNRVITLWYRPPELLLGATKYDAAVDMWSVGCIFAEMLSGKAILQGKTEEFSKSIFAELLPGNHILHGKDEPEQLNKIFELCGTPDEINWPGVSKIPWYNKFKPARPMKRRIKQVFGHFDSHALELLDKMLCLDPSKRISAREALVAEYFFVDPRPCDPRSLPTYESSHEFQTKKKRQQQRQNEEMAKRQKVPHPHQHARLPPIQQSGQANPRHWAGSNHPVNPSQQPLSSGAGHHQYGKQHGPPGGPNRYPPSGNPGTGFYPDRGGHAGGNYSSGAYPAPGRGQTPYPGSNAPSAGQRGSNSGYGAPPNYNQGNQYGGSGGNRPNSMPGNRNQQYGWQQ